MEAERSEYTVTVTPKYPDAYYRRGTFTVTVSARSKAEANKLARRQLERDGYWFKGDDASTFAATQDRTP